MSEDLEGKVPDAIKALGPEAVDYYRAAYKVLNNPNTKRELAFAQGVRLATQGNPRRYKSN